jgi:hypothetical protein
MPGQDRTGPLGQGPMTGRGLGQCGQGLNRGFGRQCRRGFGFMRGRGYRENITLSKEEEKKILEAELIEIEKEKEEIEQKLKEI